MGWKGTIATGDECPEGSEPEDFALISFVECTDPIDKNDKALRCMPARWSNDRANHILEKQACI